MLIIVTNRKLCRDDFLKRIQLLAKGKPDAIMLREKDLSICEFESLTSKVKTICEENQVPLIINQNIFVAEKLELPNIHLSMNDLRKTKNEIQFFTQIGASVHSIDEAKEAEKLGASYLVAGHIFSTNSKKGVPPRGLAFLNKVCHSVKIPVFAIGGISEDKMKPISTTGAKGVCIMSEAMICEDPVGVTYRFNILF
jgi:thiamine-phosphate diphosphorylase